MAIIVLLIFYRSEIEFEKARNEIAAYKARVNEAKKEAETRSVGLSVRYHPTNSYGRQKLEVDVADLRQQLANSVAKAEKHSVETGKHKRQCLHLERQEYVLQARVRGLEEELDAVQKEADYTAKQYEEDRKYFQRAADSQGIQDGMATAGVGDLEAAMTVHDQIKVQEQEMEQVQPSSERAMEASNAMDELAKSRRIFTKQYVFGSSHGRTGVESA